MKPRVLMVTGAYFPELSGGGLQARNVVRALHDRAEFCVLTTSTDPHLPAIAEEDGVFIRRIHVDVNSWLSSTAALLKLTVAFVRFASSVDIVNVHGFSRKTVLLLLLARLFRKRFVLTLQTGGHDEPDAARSDGAIAFWGYAHADLYLSVSPGLSRAYVDAGLPAARLRQVCNAVDTERFRPSTPGERGELRIELGLPVDLPLVLFVGFFSRDKRPDLLYDAWVQAVRGGSCSALVFVGATTSTYQEIDTGLAGTIRERSRAEGCADRVLFVGPTSLVDKYFRAADVYVLPSVREGLPIALLEAMASGLACVATRLPGSTDTLIADRVNGRLVAADDRDGFADAIRSVVDDDVTARGYGAAARQTVVERFSIQRTAADWLAAYQDVCRAQ